MNKTLAVAAVATSFLWSIPVFASTFALTITNKTSSVVDAFYASPTGEDDWEEDLFGKDSLAPGASITVRFADNRDVCKYDMMFEFQGGQLEDLTDTQNLCTLGEYEITE